jgi:precorrin-6B methylase 2
MDALRTLAYRMYDHMWDVRLGVRTGGVHPSGVPSIFNDNAECNPTAYRILEKILPRIPLSADDVLVDYGCGKGRTICFFAARALLRKVIGVEISEQWAAIAKQNAQALKNRRTQLLEVVQGNALEFDPSMGTVFYFFHPFGEKTFEAVIAKIKDDLLRNPRKIKLVYYNTVCAQMLEATGFLRQTAVLHRDAMNRPAVVLYENF